MNYEWGDRGETKLRISKLGGRISKLGGRISKLGGRISKLGGRISKLGGRISKLGGRIREIGEIREIREMELRDCFVAAASQLFRQRLMSFQRQRE
jgi:hypothetical protein